MKSKNIVTMNGQKAFTTSLVIAEGVGLEHKVVQHPLKPVKNNKGSMLGGIFEFTCVKTKGILVRLSQKTKVMFERIKTQRLNPPICSGFFMPAIYYGGVFWEAHACRVPLYMVVQPDLPHLHNSLNAIRDGLLLQRKLS